jgi:hypothetical protein
MMLVKNEIKSLLIIPLNIYSTYTRSDRTMKIITFTKIFDSYCRVKKNPDTCYNFYFNYIVATILVVEEAGVPGENNRSRTSNW